MKARKRQKASLKKAKWCNRKARDVLTYVRDAAMYAEAQPDLLWKAWVQAEHLRDEAGVLADEIGLTYREVTGKDVMDGSDEQV